MFSVVTNLDLLTLCFKSISYRISNGKGSVGSYIIAQYYDSEFAQDLFGNEAT